MIRLAMSPQTRADWRLQQLRAWLNPVLLERDQDDSGGCRGRYAERQQRHEGARGVGVVGRLRSRNAFDRPLAELLLVFGEPPLHRVGQECRNLRSTRGYDAERKANRGAAQPGAP